MCCNENCQSVIFLCTLYQGNTQEKKTIVVATSMYDFEILILFFLFFYPKVHHVTNLITSIIVQ